ncbi:Metallo-dependent phosphatase-like protein [Endogone sp. FLAS-F59071]|nr:Metallo-dependent phosphatase-like protein [Endogone sp. FLAS-F59071]|eukprot:RUS19461.1 Metallo-dependent phosphatase-like protein [Endogone sp. FLAS-F59071]
MHKLSFLVYLVLSSVLTNSGHVEALPVSDASQLSQLPFQNPWTKQPLIIADSDPTFDLLSASSPTILDVDETSFGANSAANSTISCALCKAFVHPLRQTMFSNTSRSLIMSTGVILCKLFHINTPSVCENIIPTFGPWALTVLSHTFFETEYICGLARACPKLESGFDKWEITLPEKRVESDLGRTVIETQEDNEDGDDVMFILHLSDWHSDSEYHEGYEADCDEPLCCRIPPSNPASVKRPAGKWGDFRCDSPHSLIKNMLEFIPTVVPYLDMVVVTGDQPPHDIWLETVDSVLNVLQTTTNYLNSTFNNKVFPTLGNHDSIPANSFPTSRTKDTMSNQWVYDEVSEQWSGWLPNTAISSLRARGGYSAVAAPGLKIISLNTNFFYRLNWWMLMRPR